MPSPCLEADGTRVPCCSAPKHRVSWPACPTVLVPGDPRVLVWVLERRHRLRHRRFRRGGPEYFLTQRGVRIAREPSRRFLQRLGWGQNCDYPSQTLEL